MTVKMTSNYGAFELEIDRVAAMPSPKATALLRAVLASGYAAVLADVHVDTDSLRQSMKQDEDISYTLQRWVGTISAGGPSTGVNNPVDYAIYEKARDGEHDFFKSLPALNPAYVAAIKEALRGS